MSANTRTTKVSTHGYICTYCTVCMYVHVYVYVYMCMCILIYTCVYMHELHDTYLYLLHLDEYLYHSEQAGPVTMFKHFSCPFGGEPMKGLTNAYDCFGE